MIVSVCYSFATIENDALLFYNGRYNERHDFVAMEIVNKQVQFSFSLGSEITRVHAKIEGGVSDGQWHQVTVTYFNRVGQCRIHGALNTLNTKKLKEGVKPVS